MSNSTAHQSLKLQTLTLALWLAPTVVLFGKLYTNRFWKYIHWNKFWVYWKHLNNVKWEWHLLMIFYLEIQKFLITSKTNLPIVQKTRYIYHFSHGRPDPRVIHKPVLWLFSVFIAVHSGADSEGILGQVVSPDQVSYLSESVSTSGRKWFLRWVFPHFGGY